MAAAVTLLWGATAYATSLGQLQLKYSSASPARTGYVYLDGVSHGNVYTGKYNLEIDPTVAPTGEAIDIKASATTSGSVPNIRYFIGTFCADILQSAPTSYRLYDVYHPEEAPIGGGNLAMGVDKAWDLRRLFYQHLGATATADGAAAFEACVWEIVYENSGTYNVDYTSALKGDFYVKPTSGNGWVATANTWLGTLGTDQPDIGLRVLASSGYQDFALTVPGLGADPIPEPVTMAGLMLGIGSVVTYVRKRRTA
jgi:hypothetical protein